jgi:hypothetical protein
MAELKTKATKASAKAYIAAIENEGRRKDGQVLLALFKKITGEKPVMWGTSIIGFGTYHYKSERSSQEGDWPLTGFSPRKQNLTIYIMLGLDDFGSELKKLGKHKRGAGCLYINKLADIEIRVLEKLIKNSVTLMKKKYRVR